MGNSNNSAAKVFNKLVRDKIPEVIAGNNQKGVFRELSDSEYVEELEKKLLEEVQEYLTDKNIEELADIAEVLHALAKLHGADPAELEKVRQQKSDKRGGFEKRLFLEIVTDV